MDNVSAIPARSASASVAPLIPDHCARASRSISARSSWMDCRSSVHLTPKPIIQPPSAIPAPAVAARHRESWLDGRHTVRAR